MAYVFNNDVQTDLAADLAAGATTITVNAASSPQENPPDPAGETAVLVLLDSLGGHTKREVVTYTSRTDNGDGTYDLGGVTRGQEGTSDQSWSTGDPVIQALTAAPLDDIGKPLVDTPEITYPSDGATDVETVLTIEGSAFSPLYSTDTRNYRRFQVQVAGGDWSTLVVDNQEDADNYEVSLDPDTSYEARIKDVDTDGVGSDWSPVISWTTTAAYVSQPTIVSPSGGETSVSTSPTLEGDAYDVTNGTTTDYPHIASQFKVYLVSDGSEVYGSGELSAIESHTLPDETLSQGTDYEWEVRYKGDLIGWSDWSVRTSFTTKT
ncbi:hypothetical protein, partial [Thiohalorhabdus sp.]|uniref:hypothetical protein n=1 Tax=Thiohalorhabdus sp. TaxID=3094134 RepID=UPI002FC2C6B7